MGRAGILWKHNASAFFSPFTSWTVLIFYWHFAVDVPKQLQWSLQMLQSICNGSIGETGGFQWSHTSIAKRYDDQSKLIMVDMFSSVLNYKKHNRK